ncbi:MAG TPA: hypothetical protein PKD35_04110 [Nitrosomonas sp.]|nr:hypothetical protein [Nitrosomonas sp.]
MARMLLDRCPLAHGHETFHSFPQNYRQAIESPRQPRPFATLPCTQSSPLGSRLVHWNQQNDGRNRSIRLDKVPLRLPGRVQRPAQMVGALHRDCD